MVNWDPVALTAISDDEVIHRDTKSHFYHLKYYISDGNGNPKSLRRNNAENQTVVHVFYLVISAANNHTTLHMIPENAPPRTFVLQHRPAQGLLFPPQQSSSGAATQIGGRTRIAAASIAAASSRPGDR